jgi:hypothetical protein
MNTVEFKLTEKANTYVCMDCGLLDMSGTYVLASEANERVEMESKKASDEIYKDMNEIQGEYRQQIKILECKLNEEKEHVTEWRNAFLSEGNRGDKLQKRIKVLEDALMRITYELGVPQPGYPQPVANAYDIAQAALEVNNE